MDRPHLSVHSQVNGHLDCLHFLLQIILNVLLCEHLCMSFYTKIGFHLLIFFFLVLKCHEISISFASGIVGPYHNSV